MERGGAGLELFEHHQIDALGLGEVLGGTAPVHCVGEQRLHGPARDALDAAEHVGQVRGSPQTKDRVQRPSSTVVTP